MTHHAHREQSEAKPAADGEPETDDLWSTTHSLLVRVEYSRSFEYCLKWKIPMYPRRSVRQTKSSENLQKSPSPDEEVLQRKYKHEKQKGTKDGDGVFNASKGSNRDLIDLISNSPRAKHTAEEDKGKFIEINDNGLDDSDDDRASVASSITSGPSLPYFTTPKKLTFLWDLCSDCQRLYHRAKRMKPPIPHKVVDNDPKSLTCDQWVLIKLWKPKKRVKSKKEVWEGSDLIREIMTRLQSKKYTNTQNEKCAAVEESTFCSRPRIFLKRNMKCCLKTQEKKEQKKKSKSRKRTRNNSEGSRVAKQQRLDRNDRRQYGGTGCDDVSDHHPTSGDNTRASLENSVGEEIYNQTDMLQTVGLVLSTAPEENKLKELPPKLKTQKRNGFQELLAQLRGSNSMIVKETH